MREVVIDSCLLSFTSLRKVIDNLLRFAWSTIFFLVESEEVTNGFLYCELSRELMHNVCRRSIVIDSRVCSWCSHHILDFKEYTDSTDYTGKQSSMIACLIRLYVSILSRQRSAFFCSLRFAQYEHGQYCFVLPRPSLLLSSFDFYFTVVNNNRSFEIRRVIKSNSFFKECNLFKHFFLTDIYYWLGY